MRVNGESESDFDGTVAQLLVGRSVPLRGVAVAVNGAIIPRSMWSDVLVPPGANVEILTAAAGG